MRRTLLSTFVVAVLLGASSLVQAQGTPGLKPLVTVSFAGYDEVLKDIEFLGELAGNPDLGKLLTDQLDAATDGQGIQGLDTTRPWGVIVQTDGGMEFPFAIFVPVTDIAELLALIGEVSGMTIPEPVDGVYECNPPGGEPMFVTERNGWGLFSTTKAAFDAVPDDPSTLLEGLNEKYDIAVKAQIKNIPKEVLDGVILPIKMGVQMGMQQESGESDEQYQLRSSMTNQMVDQVLTLLSDLDTITLGFAIDRDAKTSYIDVEIVAKAGSDTAEQLAGLNKSTTDLAGFDLPGAAVTFSMAYEIADVEVAQGQAALAAVKAQLVAELAKQGLPDDKLQLATKFMTDAMDVLDKTLAAKKADVAAALILKSDALTVVGGMAIVEGAKLEGVLKELAAEIAKDEPEFAQALKLDADTLGDVKFHVLSVPASELEEEMVPLVGESLDIVLGISETKVYFAVGRDALATLKTAINQSTAEPGKLIAPMKLTVAATPIAEFIASMAPGQEKQMATMVAGMLAGTAGKDHVTITATAIENGEKVRFELEEGILKLIGMAGQMAGDMMMGGPGGMQPMIEEAPF